MYKKLFALLLLSIPSLLAIAQETKKRDSYVNFNYASMRLSQDGSPKLNSEYGVAFSHGHTYYLNKTPISNCLYFGIDATWIDVNYTNYKNVKIYDGTSSSDDSDNNYIHEGEISMQVGPAIIVNPTGKLNIEAYFKYAPSFSALYANEDFLCNYGSFFTTGGVISYGIIGIGIESRFGNSKYKTTSGSDDNSDKIKTKFSGFRAYLSLRF